MTTNNTTQFETIKATALVLDANVRTEGVEADDLTTLRTSIEARGVLQPLVGWRDAEGSVHVLMGQRRALAARDLDIEVPVFVHEGQPEDVDRIVDQWVENENRAGLTNRDKATAAAQLALEGLSDTKIGKAVGMKRTEVKAARTAASSEAVAQHVNSLTLEQAAAIAQFEGDEEATAELLRIAQERPTGLDHVIARMRQGRAEQQAAEALTDELAAQGLTVSEAGPYGDEGVVALWRLNDADGNPVDAEGHAECPGRVFVLDRSYGWEDKADDEKAATPHATVDGVTVIAVEFCADLAAGGHVDRLARSTGTKKRENMTEEEQEEARAARREVIDNNKAWDAATEVRQAWVREFAARKTPPKGHEKVLLACTAHFDYTLKAAHDAVSWLGWDLNAEMKGATPKRLAQIHTAICLARWETTNHRDAWRRKDRAGQMMLTALGEWGYELSEVEKRARDLKGE